MAAKSPAVRQARSVYVISSRTLAAWLRLTAAALERRAELPKRALKQRRHGKATVAGRQRRRAG